MGRLIFHRFSSRFFLYLTIKSDLFVNIGLMFDWPKTATIEENIKQKINRATKNLGQIESLPDSDPSKAERLEKSKKELLEVESLEAEEMRKQIVSKRLKEGSISLFFVIYSPAILFLYIYTARAPQFLLWKREAELQRIKKSKNLFLKIIFKMIGVFFFLGKGFFKLFYFASFLVPKTYYPPGVRSYQTYSFASSRGGMTFIGIILWIFSFFIGIVVLLTLLYYFINIIVLSAWLIVIINYARNIKYKEFYEFKENILIRYRKWKSTKTTDSFENNMSPKK